MVRQRPNPKRLGLAPITTTPEVRDARHTPRQLTLGDVGGVQQLAPDLTPAVRAALLKVGAAPYCSVPWCDEVETLAGMCAVHSAERAAELHSALTRLRRTPSKSRKVRR